MDPYETLMDLLGQEPVDLEPTECPDRIQKRLLQSMSQAELEKANQLILSEDLENRWLIAVLRRARHLTIRS